MSTENRRKMLVIPEDRVLTLLQQTSLPREGKICLTITYLKGIPDGVAIEAVHYNFQRRTFDFAIRHESFDPVPMGTMLPEITPDVAVLTFVRVVDWKDRTDDERELISRVVHRARSGEEMYLDSSDVETLAALLTREGITESEVAS